MKVKLSLIVEALDWANVDEIYYLNTKNSRVLVSNELGAYYIDNGENIDEDDLYYDDYISLPGKYEINEYKIIQNFISIVDDQQIKNQLTITIQGPGAFRRFKDSCINYNIIDKWYKFKKDAYYELAKEWCEWNNISYYDDIEI